MLRQRIKADQSGGVQLSLIITPMLDMTFQLLAFFIMTYNPSPEEARFDVGLMAEAKEPSANPEKLQPGKVANSNPKQPKEVDEDPTPLKNPLDATEKLVNDSDIKPDTMKIEVKAVKRGKNDKGMALGKPMGLSDKDFKDAADGMPSEINVLPLLNGLKLTNPLADHKNDFSTAMDLLTKRLTFLMANDKSLAEKSTVNISVDADLHYYYFIRIQDACKAAKVKNINFNSPK